MIVTCRDFAAAPLKPPVPPTDRRSDLSPQVRPAFVTEPSPRDITQMLIDWSNGDRKALDSLIPVVYAELRRLAARHLRRERPATPSRRRT